MAAFNLWNNATGEISRELPDSTCASPFSTGIMLVLPPADRAHAAAGRTAPSEARPRRTPRQIDNQVAPPFRRPPGSRRQRRLPRPSARIRSARPSTNRSHTRFVASGVTSRSASPYLLSLRSARPPQHTAVAPRRSIDLIGQRLFATAVIPACSSIPATAGPDRSTAHP